MKTTQHTPAGRLPIDTEPRRMTLVVKPVRGVVGIMGTIRAVPLSDPLPLRSSVSSVSSVVERASGAGCGCDGPKTPSPLRCAPASSPAPPRSPGEEDGDRIACATIEWVCEACKAIQKHDVWPDGRAKQIDCVHCKAVGGMLIPTGPAMKAASTAMAEHVECLACGTRYFDRSHGCHTCNGGAIEAAEGRVIA